MANRQTITASLYRDTYKRLRLLSVARDQTVADLVDLIALPVLGELERDQGINVVGTDRLPARPARAGKATQATA
jgi:hypothetical protein